MSRALTSADVVVSSRRHPPRKPSVEVFLLDTFLVTGEFN